MSKNLVTYFSRTGNTKLVAEAVFEALPGPKEIRPIAEITDFPPFRLMFIGFPVHSHSAPYPVEVFLRRIPSGARIALFCTHGSLTGSSLSREAIHHAVAVASQAKVMGTFSCRGKVSKEALEALMKSPEHEAWAEMAVTAGTHPDASDLEDARAFARWTVILSGSHNR